MNAPKRDLNRGSADALSRAFDAAVMLALFVGVGLLLDRWLGTRPVFVIILTTLAFVGQFARAWYRYDADMRKIESTLPSRSAPSEVSK